MNAVIYDRVALKQEAKELIKGKMGAYTLYFIVYTGLVIVWSFLIMPVLLQNNHSIIFALLLVIIDWGLRFLFSFGFVAYSIEVSRGNSPAFSTFFVGFNRKHIFKVLAVNFLSTILILLASLLFVIPGIILAYSYFMANYILYDKPEQRAVQILRESRNLMKGFKFKLFVLQLSFLGWALLSVITLGIAFVYFLPYINAAYALFYQIVRKVKEQENTYGGQNTGNLQMKVY